MLTLEKTILVAQPREQVFRFLSNPANIAKLPGGQAASWISAPPHGVGSTMQLQARLVGISIRSQAEITIWDPPHQVARAMTTKMAVVHAVFSLAEAQAGTKLTIQTRITFAGVLTRAEWVFRGFVEKRFAQELEIIRYWLEAEPPTS